LFQTEHELGRRRFAASTFADNPERAAALDRKGDSIDRTHHSAIPGEDPPLGLEMLAETCRLENNRHAVPLPSASQQRAVLPRATVNSGGAASRQRSKARGQRGAKEHPGGNAARSGGWPSIAVNL